jgi:rhodanese-related sulfurtransferase
MRKLIVSAVAVIALCTAVNVQALTQEELSVVQKATNEYLATVPESGYHLLADTVLERIKSGKKDFVLVDVRMPKAKKYDQGHLPGAIYIGFRELMKPENLAKLSKDMDIIVYCDTGHEQNKALSALRLLGYRAYDMKWGFSAWKVAGPTALTLGAIEGSITNTYPLEK